VDIKESSKNYQEHWVCKKWELLLNVLGLNCELFTWEWTLQTVCRFMNNCLFYLATNFLFQKASKQYKNIKSNTFLRIPSHGFLRGSRTSAHPVWPVPVHLPGHSAWQSDYHPGHLLWLSPPHPNVLFPLEPALGWHWFTFHHHPKDDREHSNSEQSHLLCGLHHSDISFPTVLMYGWHASDCDGLWPVCSYMPPPALHSHYEPSSLCLLSVSVLSHQPVGLAAGNFDCVTIFLLQRCRSI
jgi:hypothetical protein